MTLFAWIVFGFALLPLLLGLTNIALLRAPRRREGTAQKVAILIPARNEEARLGPVLAAAQASEGADLEIIVADDHSTDGTRALVERAMADDPRVKLTTPPPPTELAGKMNACAHLGAEATGDILLFIDADVTLAPDAARRIADQMAANDFALVSGFPRQVTVTWWEKVLIPLIYAVLMGYLPLIGMKLTRWPMFAQGCGQLIAVTAESYRATGGHAVMENRLHDGVVLPGAWRKAGYGTDLIDATPLADCRMYESFDEIWKGFSKNATEAMATPVGLPVWTTLLGLGHVLPVLTAMLALLGFVPPLPGFGALAAILAYRLMLTVKFRQDWLGALTHPFGIAMLVALQWCAFFDARAGKRVSWKGREYVPN